jgi:adenosyl cobinamide kinase/adenosyl cobinamide phosphate guanylyltransferase
MITVDYTNDKYCAMNHDELSYMVVNCSSDKEYTARIKDHMEFNGER